MLTSDLFDVNAVLVQIIAVFQFLFCGRSMFVCIYLYNQFLYNFHWLKEIEKRYEL